MSLFCGLISGHDYSLRSSLDGTKFQVNGVRSPSNWGLRTKTMRLTQAKFRHSDDPGGNGMLVHELPMTLRY